MLSKLILEKYLNNRFIAGIEEGEARGREEGRQEGRQEGREEANEAWRAWYERMTEARERGEVFDEAPPDSQRKNC